MSVTTLTLKDYPIYIGSNLLSQINSYFPALAARDILIITNPTVGQYYQDTLLQALTPQLAGKQLQILQVIDSEIAKSFSYLEQIYNCLGEHAYGRDSVILALGGGVIGDLAGYAAATYLRGIDFYQIPTSLLAQVDSSVGGKTAINYQYGKNLIGAFYQPRGVLIDIEVLQTLAPREFSAGMAEVIKYGCIFSQEFLSYLQNQQALINARDPQVLQQVITQCCRFKAAIVAQDEKETSGQRALLNFGHTLGHAIEQASAYQLLHGECVALGMVFATLLGNAYYHSLGRTIATPPENQASQHLPSLPYQAVDPQILITLLQAYQLPTRLPSGYQATQLLTLLRHDKKVANGIVNFILLNGYGSAWLCKEIDPSLTLQLVHEFIQ